MAKSGLEGDVVARLLDVRRLVFVDEMGTNISLSPVYGWAKKGERAYCSVPRNLKAREHHPAFEHESVEGMGPPLAVEGAINSEVFETYVVERVLEHRRCGKDRW